MSIKTITTDDLRRMKGKEGLILQGCGGDPQEWLDGINDLLTKEGILLNGSKFENCSVFKHDDLTCILYPFEGTEQMCIRDSLGQRPSGIPRRRCSKKLC